MAVKASEIAKKLNLKAHIEGGFYDEVFRDNSVVLSKSLLPPQSEKHGVFLGDIGQWAMNGFPINPPESALINKVDRAVSSSIYFLLPSGSVSRLHRIPCAETWHFYLGEPITVMELDERDGSVKLTCLGPNLLEGQQPQYTVPPNVWFGSFPTNDVSFSTEGELRLATKAATPRDPENHYSLVGCTCAPAFQFEDFELASRSHLISRCSPNYASLISLLTASE